MMRMGRSALRPCSPRQTPRTPMPISAPLPRRNYALTATHQQLAGLSLFLQDKFREYESGSLSMREMLAALPPGNPTEVFSNATTELKDVSAWGFDYDFTLASYTDELQPLIYDFAVDNLVKNGGYPAELKAALHYDSSFAVRGLYFDKQHGFLLKLNYLNNIQRDSVYYGRRNLTEQEVLAVYGIWKIPEMHLLEKFKLMSDIFCLPEACLLADVIQFMVDQKYQFHPAIVAEDVRKAIDQVHLMGQFQGMIKKNPERYLEKTPRLAEFLTRLRDAKKSVFMLTNNVFPYIDDGMNYLVGEQLPAGMKHWTELFDVVMTRCRKPYFFTSKNQEPFRAIPMYNNANVSPWKPVGEFQPGLVTTDGSLTEMNKITGWKGNTVLYFGDHLDNDLVEPSRIQGWRTGVILKELERDIEIQNIQSYRMDLASLLLVEELMRRGQLLPLSDPAREAFLKRVCEERIRLRISLKQPFNPQFGSVFRTHVNPTLFAYYLQRYADIYTSSLANLINYPMDYSFYPSRSYMPHEFHIGRFFLDYTPEP